MKRFMISLGVVVSLYGSISTTGNISTEKVADGAKKVTGSISNNDIIDKITNAISSVDNLTDFFGIDSSKNKYSSKITLNNAKFSNGDMQKEVEFFADPSRCFNAFSIPNPSDLSFSPFSILTQVQNEDFYLKIIRKHTPICAGITDVNVTLIDKNGNKIDYSTVTPSIIKKLIDDESKTDGYIIMPIIFNVHNAYRDVFVHFSYKIKNKEVSCEGSAYASASNNDKIKVSVGASAKCYLKTTTSTREENATDDFAVRPKQFNISTDSTVFVGKPLKVNINLTGYKGNISTNYNANDVDLNTTITDSNTALSYYYDIFKGKVRNYKFVFKKPSDDVKIKISEKLGKEWAIVDSDDTKDNRRLIKEGESNSIKVLETSKNWAGVGTGEEENTPSKNSINSDIRDTTNKNLKFHKMAW